MSEFVRVRDAKTGHEYTTREHLVVDGLKVIDKPTHGRDHLPLPALYRVPLGTKPAPNAGGAKRAPKPVTPEPAANASDPTDGQTAESEQEN